MTKKQRNISVVKNADGKSIVMINDIRFKERAFAVSVYGENGLLERYNVFHASLLFRHANDKKMYLYDIIDIKKETSNLLES